MNQIIINLTGVAAALLTTFSFVPQFLKIIRTKETKGISPIMIIQIMLGLILWIVYGLLRQDIVIIAANSVGFLIILATLFAYLKYRK